MQALCHWEVQRDASEAMLDTFLTQREATGSARRWVARVVGAYWKDAKKIDQAIAEATEHWALDRISPVERNVIRVAVAELSELGVPPKVAMNEAIEIARAFGGADSPRFVNGILDKLLVSQGEDDA